MDILDAILPADQPGQPKDWSDNQQAVFNAVKDDQNILISAVAGSGKTTTIIEAMRHVSGSSLFMAFNKSIAQDIAAKVSLGDVKTLNALGHGLMMKNAGGSLNAKKALEIVKIVMNEMGLGDRFSDDGYTISRIVGLAKNNAFGIGGRPEGVDEFIDLIDASSDVEAADIAAFAEVAYTSFVRSRDDFTTFDFDDQLYLPLSRGYTYPNYNNIFVDECQDLSPIQHAMLEEMSGPNSRLVGVGDRFQAIYGFRGALTNSMDLLKSNFHMTELPLDISYRCSAAVVAEAQLYCDLILPRPEADIGQISVADSDPLLHSNALILCRNNAPLFKAILAHVRAKAPCRVLSNFLDSFQSFVRSFKTVHTADLQDKLARWYEKEHNAAKAKNFRGKMFALTDKYETVSLLCKEFAKTEDVLRMVKRLGEGVTGPTFSTIHKAKGLEHENVYILRPDLMPAVYASSPEQKQQESNLTYVAITRAKINLTYGASLT